MDGRKCYCLYPLGFVCDHVSHLTHLDNSFVLGIIFKPFAGWSAPVSTLEVVLMWYCWSFDRYAAAQTLCGVV